MSLRQHAAMSAPLPDGVTLIDHPLVQVKLTQLRDARTDTTGFRARLRELSALVVVEVTRTLTTRPVRIETPLASCEGRVLVRPVIVAPILRAGLGLAEGMLDLLPDASVAHIGLSRHKTTLRPESYFFKAPAHLAEADVIVLDPMLATGSSAAGAVAQLKTAGATSIRFVCLVSCRQGLAQLRSEHPDVEIYTAAIDAGMNEQSYVVPGFGNAGDRYFGTTG